MTSNSYSLRHRRPCTMHYSDKVHLTSQEKCNAQLQQANRMMRTQGKDVENQGGGAGFLHTTLLCPHTWLRIVGVRTSPPRSKMEKQARIFASAF